MAADFVAVSNNHSYNNRIEGRTYKTKNKLRKKTRLSNKAKEKERKRGTSKREGEGEMRNRTMKKPVAKK